MARLDTKPHILSVMIEEYEKDPRKVLTAGNIGALTTAQLVNSGVEMEYSISAKSVRGSMTGIKKLAFQNGLVIVAIRLKHLRRKSKSKEVYGYKIADDEDKEYLAEDMEILRILRNGTGDMLRTVSGIAKRTGLLKPEDLLSLGLPKEDEK